MSFWLTLTDVTLNFGPMRTVTDNRQCMGTGELKKYGHISTILFLHFQVTECETSFIGNCHSHESPLLQKHGSRQKGQRVKYPSTWKISSRLAIDSIIACETCEIPLLGENKQAGEITTEESSDKHTKIGESQKFIDGESPSENSFRSKNLWELKNSWKEINQLFTKEEDEHFQKNVKFVTRYVKNLSRFLEKIDHERIREDEWKMLAKILNRFFLVVTIIIFGVTAIIVFLLYNIKS